MLAVWHLQHIIVTTFRSPFSCKASFEPLEITGPLLSMKYIKKNIAAEPNCSDTVQ